MVEIPGDAHGAGREPESRAVIKFDEVTDDALRRSPQWSRARVDSLVAAIVVAQFVVRTLGARRGTWLNDDWTLLHVLSTRSFALGDYFIVYAGNLSPGLFAFYQLLWRLAPRSYDAAVLVAGALQAGVTLLMYIVLRRLFGTRPLTAVLLFWFASTTMTLSSLWVNVAFYMLPFQLGFVAALILLLRYLDRPSTARALAIAAVEIAALLSYEKAVLIPLVLFSLVAWFPIASAMPLGLRRAFREYRRLWTLLASVLVGYVVLYLSLVSVGQTTPSSGTRSGPSVGDVARLTGGLVFRSFTTSIVGGPWRWTRPPGVAADPLAADPPVALIVVAGAAVLALVVWTLVRRRTARAAWLLLLTYLLVDVAAIAFGRLGEWHRDLDRYYRYVGDAAIPAALVLGFALLPTLQERASATPGTRSPPTRRGLRLSLSVVLATAFLVSTAVSYASAFDAWGSNYAKVYTANARRGFPLVAGTGLLSQDVPQSVLSGLFYPYNTTEVVLSAVPGHPDFPPFVNRLFALDAQGHIVPAHVQGFRSPDGPAAGCGWPISASNQSVPLTTDVFRWTWYVHIVYRSRSRISASVVFGEGSRRVLFDPAHNDVFLLLVGAGSKLQIRGIPPDANLCVQSVTVGGRDVEIRAQRGTR